MFNNQLFAQCTSIVVWDKQLLLKKAVPQYIFVEQLLLNKTIAINRLRFVLLKF